MLLSSCIRKEWTLLNRITRYSLRFYIERCEERLFDRKIKDKHLIKTANQWTEYTYTHTREAFKEFVVHFFLFSTFSRYFEWTSFMTTSASLHLCQSLFGGFLCVSFYFVHFGKNWRSFSLKSIPQPKNISHFVHHFFFFSSVLHSCNFPLYISSHTGNSMGLWCVVFG